MRAARGTRTHTTALLKRMPLPDWARTANLLNYLRTPGGTRTRNTHDLPVLSRTPLPNLTTEVCMGREVD